MPPESGPGTGAQSGAEGAVGTVQTGKSVAPFAQTGSGTQPLKSTGLVIWTALPKGPLGQLIDVVVSAFPVKPGGQLWAGLFTVWATQVTERGAQEPVAEICTTLPGQLTVCTSRIGPPT
jgi:hypothetical protein